MVEIFPIYACNLKCVYCMMSTPRKEHGYISGKTAMDLATFDICVEGLKRFPRRVRVLRFAGLGEPLLNKDLAAMVKIAKDANVAETIEVLTNGTLLTLDKGRELIAAGMTRFIISVQGTSKEKCSAVSGSDFDFDQFIKNLQHLYFNKNGAIIYVKTMDTALADAADVKLFLDTFDPICDLINIEHTVPIHPVVDYKQVIGEGHDKTQFGREARKVECCPRPFMSIHVLPDGNIVPCYSLEYPAIIGNVALTSLYDAWRSLAMNEFRQKMTVGSRDTCAACAKCKVLDYRIFEEDDIDTEARRLREYYGGKTCA